MNVSLRGNQDATKQINASSMLPVLYSFDELKDAESGNRKDSERDKPDVNWFHD